MISQKKFGEFRCSQKKVTVDTGTPHTTRDSTIKFGNSKFTSAW